MSWRTYASVGEKGLFPPGGTYLPETCENIPLPVHHHQFSEPVRIQPASLIPLRQKTVQDAELCLFSTVVNYPNIPIIFTFMLLEQKVVTSRLLLLLYLPSRLDFVQSYQNWTFSKTGLFFLLIHSNKSCCWKQETYISLLKNNMIRKISNIQMSFMFPVLRTEESCSNLKGCTELFWHTHVLTWKIRIITSTLLPCWWILKWASDLNHPINTAHSELRQGSLENILRSAWTWFHYLPLKMI